MSHKPALPAAVVPPGNSNGAGPSCTDQHRQTSRQTPARSKQPSKKNTSSFSDAFAYLKDTPEFVAPPLHPISVANASSTSNAQPVAGILQQQQQTNKVKSYHLNVNTIIVNPRQKGNPVLDCIQNVPWEYGDIVPDYQIGAVACALFLRLRYHRLHPEYIYHRLQLLGAQYNLRVVLILVDIDDHQPTLRELHKLFIINNLTIYLAWSKEEAARYLETFKIYEFKGPEAIKERIEDDYLAKITSTITQIKSVNKTDVLTLSSHFGSLHNLIHAPIDRISQCPGFGQQKAKRLHEAFRQPFKITRTKKGRAAAKETQKAIVSVKDDGSGRKI